MTNRTASDQLIVALDVPTVLEAAAIVENLGDAANFYKIGYQLAFAGGLHLADERLYAAKNGGRNQVIGGDEEDDDELERTNDI